MTTTSLTILIVSLAVLVVVAVFLMLWRESTSARTGAVAVIAGLVLVAWMLFTSIAASRGAYLPTPTPTPPLVGVQLVIALAGMAICLVLSPSLRALLTNQRDLIRLNVWRLVGVVFLVLMVAGQAPALWALPTGIGDVLIGATAFWVASGLDAPGGARRAVIFNWLGLLDLLVAVSLGVMSSPGPAQLFHTNPTMELATHFPLVLVPTFLVPLAVMVHAISLWQLSSRAASRNRVHVQRDVRGSQA
jgi:hypothetical protein